MFKNKLAFVLLCLVLILSACGSSDETTTENKGNSGGKAVKLTFTEPARLLSVAPLYVAIEQGFLKKKELTLRLYLVVEEHKSLLLYYREKLNLPSQVLEVCSLLLTKVKIYWLFNH